MGVRGSCLVMGGGGGGGEGRGFCERGGERVWSDVGGIGRERVRADEG